MRADFWNRRIARAPDGDPPPGNPPPGNPPAGNPPPGNPPPGNPPPGASWRDTLPEPMRAHAGLAKFKDVSALAEGYVNAEKMIGADKIVLPGKDAKPEEWDGVYNKLGRPEKADGYTFPEVKDRPYTDKDKQLQATFAPVAHKLGLSQAQLAGLVEWQNGLVTAGIEAAATGRANAEAELRKEKGDGYEAFIANGQAGLKAMLSAAGEKFERFSQIQLSDGTYAFDNPVFAKLFATFGEAISESGFQGGGGGKNTGAFSSPKAAKAELDNLFAKDFKDPQHPYNNKRDPQHKAWSDRVMRLNELASQAGGDAK